METNWIIELSIGEQKLVRANAVGVAQDGSLLCFTVDGQGQATAFEGYAPGQWTHFYRSNITPAQLREAH
jgi:hypothetical protein